MCVQTTQVYRQCGCRNISYSICYDHIEYTRKQIDDKPCPKSQIKFLGSIEGGRVGTRNHPGPCPRFHTSYTFQSKAEAEREARSKLWSQKEIKKEGSKGFHGMWNASNKLGGLELATSSSGLPKMQDEEMQAAGEIKVEAEQHGMELDEPPSQPASPPTAKRRRGRFPQGPIMDVDVPPFGSVMEGTGDFNEEEAGRDWRGTSN